MKIAILGAGVAGVSSAIALKQMGFDVQIFERHKSASNIGAGIVVWPNAAYVLQQLGVLDEIISVSGQPSAMRRISHTGEALGTIDIESINKQMGFPSLSILRYDFQNILISKLKSVGIEIQYDHTITQINTNKSDQAVVSFNNGLKITADVILGADGRMASHARQYVFGNNKPIYQGFINWIGVINSNKVSFDNIEVSDYWGTGERFGIVPISSHKAYWAGGAASGEIKTKQPDHYKQELLSIFSNWPAPIHDVIKFTPAEHINKIYVHDHNPIKTWYKLNLLVIGDAAHAPLPTSGQGACQALEDAWHFANCLTDHTDNIQQAFHTFTSLRHQKTSNIIMAGRGLAASLFNSDEDYCQTRNYNSKHANPMDIAASMATIWGQNLPLASLHN